VGFAVGFAVSDSFELTVPTSLLNAIAERAADIVFDRLRDECFATPSPFLTVGEAAEYLRAKPQRIYDLLSSRRLTRHKDGRRVLISRVELDEHLREGGRATVAPALPHFHERRAQSGAAR